MTARLVCLLGAESTGKTTLAQDLATHFGCPWVPEYMREFCDVKGRTPFRHEQADIVQTQVMRENMALQGARAQGQPWVFCDTGPLLTAIYSEFVFADTALLNHTRGLHRRYALTLVLEPDIAWVSDGLQREGAHVRGPVQALIERELKAMGVPWQRVAGLGNARLGVAVQCVHAIQQPQSPPS